MSNSAWGLEISGEESGFDFKDPTSLVGKDVFSGRIVTSATGDSSYEIVDLSDLGRVEDNNPGIYSSESISQKGEIPEVELEEIINKINVIMGLENNWNGPGTFAPSHQTVHSAVNIINFYQEFIRTNEVYAASVQVYPLNGGGVGLELITRVLSLVVKIQNGNFTSQSGIVDYYITDDEGYDSEGKLTPSEIERLFVQLHVALRDI
jgi:hypothetical protein